MPRIARLNQESTYFHLMTKGFADYNIFEKEEDKDYLISLYKAELDKIKILAYCIMSNHTHFLIKVDNLENLSKAMKNINQKYSYNYKKKYQYRDKVFKERFKSKSIFTIKQLFENIRYIHNNPLEAGLVRRPSDYKYSSFNEYLQINELLIDKELKSYVLESFGNVEEFKSFHSQMQEYKDSLK